MATPFVINPALVSGIEVARSIVGIGSNVDVVGIFDADSFRQLFADGRPIRAFVREYSKVMDHPVETGAVLSDHHIIMPVEIEMPLMVPAAYYSSTYEQLRNAMINATKLSVQTKSGVYNNMIISEIPHKEDPEMFDSIVVNVRLREVQFVVPSTIARPNAPANYQPLDPQWSDIVRRGQLTPLVTTLPVAALDYINSIYAWGL